jgi:acetoin utilization deacetylase AcuC-like enzyme
MVKIFYNPNMSVKENTSYSPSASKPRLQFESWMRLGLPSVEVEDFKPLTVEELSICHDPQFVDDLLNCRIRNGFGNIGESAKCVAQSLPWTNGAVVAATKYTVASRLPSFAGVAGLHHSSWNSVGPFTNFNGLMIAAIIAHTQLGIKRIAIIDCDAHSNHDGVGQIIEHLGIDYVKNFSFGSLGICPGQSAKQWLKKFPETLLGLEDCDLWLYQAGADAHEKDDLGSGSLTTEQMRRRDSYVYETAKLFGVGVVTVLGGAYQWDAAGTISPILRLHDQTLTECWIVYEG